MAVIHTASIVSDIRGSVATETYARNRGGLYTRKRAGPHDNTGGARVHCRTCLAAVSRAWSDTLTEAQRATWRAYAHRHPGLDRWGNPSITTGHCAFTRHNWYNYQFNEFLWYLDAPPGPPLTQPVLTMTADSVTTTITIAVPPANHDPPAQDAWLWLYQGREQNPGVNFYASPWTLLDYNWCFDGEWGWDPWTIDAIGLLTSGQKIWTRILIQYWHTGEISRPYFPQCIINPFDGDPRHHHEWWGRRIARLHYLIDHCPPDAPRRLATFERALERMEKH